MPFDQIDVFKGCTELRPSGTTVRVVHGLAEAFSTPKENVRVYTHGVPKENWGIAGVASRPLRL